MKRVQFAVALVAIAALAAGIIVKATLIGVSGVVGNGQTYTSFIGPVSYTAGGAFTLGSVPDSGGGTQFFSVFAPDYVFRFHVPGNNAVSINIVVPNANGSGAAGNGGGLDFKMYGQVDTDGSAPYDGIQGNENRSAPGAPLLGGSLLQFGFANDQQRVDFRFALDPSSSPQWVARYLMPDPGYTGGAQQVHDIGVSSVFEGSTNPPWNAFPAGQEFGQSFVGGAKTEVVPIACGSSIGDFVWRDLNGNGKQDAGEPGLDNVKVILNGTTAFMNVPVHLEMLTGPNGPGATSGFYQFTNLCLGSYTISIDGSTIPAGFLISPIHAAGTTPVDDSDDPAGTPVTINAGNYVNGVQTVDFGFRPPPPPCTGVIGNFVWFDSDRDGLQTFDMQNGIGGVKVRLTKPDMTTVDFVTGAGGAYQFTGLCAGHYNVAVVDGVPAGLGPTSYHVGMDTTADSDAPSQDVDLATGETNNTIDFGYSTICSGEIGDFVWIDANGNGIQDNNESGIAGWTVQLNGPNGMTSTLTNAYGYYTFNNLCAGNYTVKALSQVGYVYTLYHQGAANADSDANGLPVPVTLATNTSTNYTIDFGYLTNCTGTIGDFVFLDSNENGIQDGLEFGLDGTQAPANITLTRVVDNAVLQNVQQGVDGFYQFVGVCPGQYRINIQDPTGYTPSPTSPPASGTPSTDSNPNPTLITVTPGNFSDQTVDFGYIQIPGSSTPVVNLNVGKTDNVTSYVPGGVLTYTIIVNNFGPSQALSVHVHDNKPSQITSWAWACTGTTGGAFNCSPAADSANNFDDFLSMPPNSSITYTVTANVAANATGDLSNTVTVNQMSGVFNVGSYCVSNLNGDGIQRTFTIPGGRFCSSTDVDTPPASLKITKTDNVATYLPGATLSYTITVGNNGPLAVTGATVSDARPPQIASWSWACTGATGSATGCDPQGNVATFTDVVNLPAGSTITYTVTAVVAGNASGSLPNTATVTPPPGTPSIPNACASVNGTYNAQTGACSSTDTDTPLTTVDLKITKTDGITTYLAGGTVTYTIVVSNAGPAAANNATVTDAKPSQVSTWTWVCFDATGGATGCDGAASGSSDFSDQVNLPANSSITYKVTANISASAAGDMVNTATVAPPSGMINPGTSCTAAGSQYDQQTGKCSSTDIDTSTLGNGGRGSIGNFVWYDQNLNGIQDNGEPGISNVHVEIAGPNGYTDHVTTDFNGFYLFPGLRAGAYTLTMEPPPGYISTLTGKGTTATDSNLNPASVTLATDTTNDLTIDFGLTYGQDLCPPAGSGGPSPVGTLAWGQDAQNNLYVRYSQNRGINDNSYGTGAINWTSGHTFSDLTGSDKAQFKITNISNQTIMDFYLDYLSSKSGTASGYASLGPSGGDGSISVGSTSDFASWDSSLAKNLNGLCVGGNCSVSGVALTTNSPAATPVNDSGQATGAFLGKWDYVNSYEFVIKGTKFAQSGAFGGVAVGLTHNSPAKAGSNAITPLVCGPQLGACVLGYPYSGTQGVDGPNYQRTSTVFNENEVLAAFGLTRTSMQDTVQLWANDEHAPILGARTAADVTNNTNPVTPMPSNPGRVTNPLVGNTTVTDPFGRPMFPEIYITDVTGLTDDLSNPVKRAAYRAGDWQYGGTPVPPNDIFGTWKGAVQATSGTKPFTVDADPAKNDWNLGAGSDTPLGGFSALNNQGYGTEARWNVGALTYQGQPLVTGRTYRIQFIVHDGDQNKVGGDVGQACVLLKKQAPLPPPPSPDLAVTKTDSKTTVQPGSSTTYSVVVSNAGPSLGDGAVLSDPAVAGLSVTSVTCGNALGGAVCPVAGNVTVGALQAAGITIPTLPSGSSVTFTVAATVTGAAGTTVTNTASVAAAQGSIDPNSANNSVSDTDSVTGPFFTLTKSGSSSVKKNTNYTYTLTYKNTGNATANNVQIIDVLPSGTTFVSATAGGVNNSGTVKWTIASLAAGAQGSVQVTVKWSSTGTKNNSGTIQSNEVVTPISSNTVATTVNN